MDKRSKRHASDSDSKVSSKTSRQGADDAKEAPPDGIGPNTNYTGQASRELEADDTRR